MHRVVAPLDHLDGRRQDVESSEVGFALLPVVVDEYHDGRLVGHEGAGVMEARWEKASRERALGQHRERRAGGKGRLDTAVETTAVLAAPGVAERRGCRWG